MAKIPESRVIDFIAAVEAEPGIWNHRSKNYSQNRKKCLTKLAQQFNTTHKVVKDKWDNLRDYFNSLKKTYKETNPEPRSGAGAPEPVSKPTWKYWDHMQFMFKLDKEPMTEIVSSMDPVQADSPAPPDRENSAELTSDSPVSLSEGSPFCDRGDPSIATPCSSGTDSNSRPSSRTNKRRRPVADDNISSAINSANSALQSIVMKIGSNSKPQQQAAPSHIDLFFNSLAAQFKLIPAANQPSAMLQLQSIITQAMVNPPQQQFMTPPSLPAASAANTQSNIPPQDYSAMGVSDYRPQYMQL